MKRDSYGVGRTHYFDDFCLCLCQRLGLLTVPTDRERDQHDLVHLSPPLQHRSFQSPPMKIFQNGGQGERSNYNA